MIEGFLFTDIIIRKGTPFCVSPGFFPCIFLCKNDKNYLHLIICVVVLYM